MNFLASGEISSSKKGSVDMIVNLYVHEGKVIGSHVDEVTQHRRGDALSIEDKRYILTELSEFEHLDYLSVVRVNYLVAKPPEIDIEEESLDHVHNGEIQTNE